MNAQMLAVVILLIIIAVVAFNMNNAAAPEPLFVVHREKLLQQSRMPTLEMMSIGAVREPMLIGAIKEPMIGAIREPLSIGAVREPLSIGAVREPLMIGAVKEPLSIGAVREPLLQQRRQESFTRDASNMNAPIAVLLPMSPVKSKKASREESLLQRPGEIISSVPRWNEGFLARASTGGSVVIDVVDMPRNYAPYIPPSPPPASIETFSQGIESFESPNVTTSSQFSILNPNLVSTQMANSTFNYGDFVPRYLPNLPMMDNVDRTLLVNAALKPRRAELWFTTWCGYCRTMRPIWEKVKSDISSIPGNQFSFAEFDADKVPNEIVKSYPTIFLIDENNKRHKYSGQQDYVALRTFLLAPMFLE